MKLLRTVVTVTCCTICIVLVSIFWYQRLRLGLVRYFDMDEFMYLHWAYRLILGKMPYIDFFLFVPPGYILFLAPLFWFWQGTAVAIAARVLSAGVFSALCVVVGLLFWEMRKSWIAVVAVLIVSVLPMPSDKFLEIRPDTLSMVFALAGMVLQVRWMRTNRTAYALWAGILYAASLLVFQKTFPTVGLALAVAMVFRNPVGVIRELLAGRKLTRVLRNSSSTGFMFLVGLAIPWIVCCLWAILSGHVGEVFYLVLKAPFEVARSGKLFSPGPVFFFLSNPTYYGGGGYSLGYIGNLALWGIGGSVCLSRLLAAFMNWRKRVALTEFLLAGSMMFQAFFYIASPIRFPQYLIPVGVFVAFYVADAISGIWLDASKSKAGMLLFGATFLFLVAGSYRLFWSVHSPKFWWTNQPHLTKMQEIYDTIPTNQYILDLEGRTIYYPDPYYVCCLSFGQFWQFLSRPLPSLTEALERTKTKYIYQAEIDRISLLLPADQAYIREHYYPTRNGELWVSKDW